MSNQEYQETLGKADILIDQMIWGSYGVAAQQALQSGKVVVGYLLEDRVEKIFENNCPIVNATIDTLFTTLTSLLDKEDLDDMEQKSVLYYERLHTPLAVAKRLINVIDKSKKK